MQAIPNMNDYPEAFGGEITFAKSDGYISPLHILEACNGGEVSIRFPNGWGDAGAFRHLAAELEVAETAQAWVGGHGMRLALVAAGENNTNWHSLDWLNLSERKTSDEQRQCHDIYLTVDGEHLQLTFNHGKFGYRHERHSKWSTAFARLAQLLAGECTWKQFGDPESQNTMLGKGQFYWQDQKSLELVPVDNFVFRVADLLDIRLAGVGHRCSLDVERTGYESGHEWYADYSEGILRMADIFADVVDLENFGTDPAPEQHANTRADKAPETGVAPLSARGHFYVESIYASADVWLAPVLVYKTAEGLKATLQVKGSDWHVRLCDEHGQWKERSFARSAAPDALRVLARVLNGTLLHHSF